MQKARSITTTQEGIHDKLTELVERYRQSQFQRPIQTHTKQVFDESMAWLDDWSGDVILDSCCGVGESTAQLSKQFPAAKVIGLDKSAARLDKHHAYAQDAKNYRVFRADVNDYWRLAAQQKVTFARHCLFYPNPYPKPSQIQKRWYASAVMPAFMSLAPITEVRSNWRLYLEEFAQAALCYGVGGRLEQIGQGEPVTPFERKYINSGQACYSLKLER